MMFAQRLAGWSGWLPPNEVYGVHLAYDGIAGAKTLAALGKHYVKRGEKQYLVSFVQVTLAALNYDPNGIENPGIFGSGLENAVKVFSA